MRRVLDETKSVCACQGSCGVWFSDLTPYDVPPPQVADALGRLPRELAAKTEEANTQVQVVRPCWSGAVASRCGPGSHGCVQIGGGAFGACSGGIKQCCKEVYSVDLTLAVCGRGVWQALAF